MHRLAALATLLLAGSALAHFEPVRVLMTFPTATRSGLKIEIVGEQSGSRIAGALVELSVTGPVQLEERLTEVGPGVYQLDRSFPPGEYVFTFADRTYAQETLSKRVEATLPRPPEADVFTWAWPATGAASSPSQTGRSLPLALVGLLAVPLLLGAVLVLRGKMARQSGPG